jgi:glycosyltransferase involved in cell wall biosynthesis
VDDRAEYLLVVQAPCYRVNEQTFATEGAFAEHLRVLQQKLFPRFERIWIAAPQYTDQFYRENCNHLGHIYEGKDKIFYVALNRTDTAVWKFWTNEALGIWKALRARTGRSKIVHSGLAWDVRRPIPLFAGLAARLDGCKTIFVVDIDFRKDAWRSWKTGLWSTKNYVFCKLVYDPIRLAHMRWATRTSSLSLLKGESMVRDFGRGRENVKNFWDTPHSIEQIIDRTMLDARLKSLKDRRRPISLIYFGRFVPYKGLDRMIEAVWNARASSGQPFVLELVGNGHDRSRLQALVEKLAASDAVHFNDPLPYGSRLFEKIRSADLSLATPLIEDTPRSAFDSLASGLPILAFDIEYFGSLSKETIAVLTTPWPDIDQFAKQLLQLNDDRARLQQMSRAAVEFARANTQEIWIDRRIKWTFELLKS